MKQLNDNTEKEEQERLTKNNIKEEKIEAMPQNKLLTWLESVLMLIQNYGVKKILQAFFLIGFGMFFFMFVDAIREQDLVKEILNSDKNIHTEASTARKEIDPKIVKTLTRMLYSMEADRVGVLEMHNGKENPTSLPFLYCDMTYEETKENVSYIAEEYENLNMSKFQFPSFLYKNKIFYGTVEDVTQIDKKLGLRLEMNDVKYIGMVLIRTSTDIGFITISWLNEPKLKRDEIIADLTYYVQEIGTYLDYGQYKQMNKN